MARHRAPRRRGPRRARHGLTGVAVVGGALSMIATNLPAEMQLVSVDPVEPSAAAELATVMFSARPDAASSAPSPSPATTAQPARQRAQQVVVTATSGGPGPSEAGSSFTDLVEAIERAEAERAQQAEEQAASDDDGVTQLVEDATTQLAATAQPSEGASSGEVSCGLDTSGLGPVLPWVEAAAVFLGCQFGQPDMIGVAPRSGSSQHPDGLAVDFMVDPATGDALASCALANWEALNIRYIIWQQRINFGSGWDWMEDRGGPTANHMDHVHISFEPSGGGPSPQPC